MSEISVQQYLDGVFGYTTTNQLTQWIKLIAAGGGGGDSVQYQQKSTDLTAIAALTGTGILKRVGTSSWALDVTGGGVSESYVNTQIENALDLFSNDVVLKIGSTITGNLVVQGTLVSNTKPLGTRSEEVATTNFVMSQIDAVTVASGQDKYYRHNQGVSSTSWAINHNLNKYPSVTVRDSAGSVIEGHIQYVDHNNVIASFTAPFSGYAEMN